MISSIGSLATVALAGCSSDSSSNSGDSSPNPESDGGTATTQIDASDVNVDVMVGDKVSQYVSVDASNPYIMDDQVSIVTNVSVSFDDHTADDPSDGGCLGLHITAHALDDGGEELATYDASWKRYGSGQTKETLVGFNTQEYGISMDAISSIEVSVTYSEPGTESCSK